MAVPYTPVAPLPVPSALPKTPCPLLEEFTPTVPEPEGLELIPYTPFDAPDVAELLPKTPLSFDALDAPFTPLDVLLEKVPVPCTASVDVGAVVLMPILAVPPVPVW